jgi:hypothetical protein
MGKYIIYGMKIFNTILLLKINSIFKTKALQKIWRERVKVKIILQLPKIGGMLIKYHH